MNTKRSAAVCLAMCGLSVVASEVAGEDAPLTTWDGVYTVTQAERGQRQLEQHCVVCHAGNLRGTQAAPGIAGVEMLYVWDGRNLSELLDYLRSNMPPGQAGLLADQDYTDIIAGLLRASGFPASDDRELPAAPAKLERIVIRRKISETESG